MPNKTPLATVKLQLPPFVQIVDATYRGTRYRADFIDSEHGPFTAIVAAVIKHQHGAPSRSNARRSKPYGKRITLAQFKARLPDYLTIYDDTWHGLRAKAMFRDVMHGDFEAYCCNVLRGKGYCKARNLDAFRKAVMISPEEIQQRLDKCYGVNVARLVPDSYRGTNEMASFDMGARGIVRYVVDLACRGALNDTRCRQFNWRNAVLSRDGGKCVISGAVVELEAHHVLSKSIYPERRFDVVNGITLCSDVHREFHSRYGYKTNAVQFLAFAKAKGIDLTARLSELL